MYENEYIKGLKKMLTILDYFVQHVGLKRQRSKCVCEEKGKKRWWGEEVDDTKKRTSKSFIKRMTIIEMGTIEWLQSATFGIGVFLDDLGHG